MIHGVFIPGVAVAAREVPVVPGVLALENPELGAGVRLERDYTLEELAELHTATLARLALAPDVTLCGYSMGGMILAIMAALFRSKLPARARFVFLATSPNYVLPAAAAPAENEPVHTVGSGSEEEYARALVPYFSEYFPERQPRRFAAYVRYRALGLNGQSPQALFRQLFALKRCRAYEYFPRVEGAAATFIGSRADRIFGSTHNAALAKLCPDARHVELEGVGHLIHQEEPLLVRGLFDGGPFDAQPELARIAA